MRPGSHIGEEPVDLRRIVAYVQLSIGGLCVAVAVGLAFFLAWLVYLVVQTPGEVPLLAQLMGVTSSRLIAFNGNLDGRTFEVVLGEPLYWILVVLAAAVLLAAVGGVAKALARIGGELLRDGSAQLKPPTDS